MKTGLVKCLLCAVLLLSTGAALHAQRGGGGGGGQRGGGGMSPGGFPGGGGGGFPSGGRNNVGPGASTRNTENSHPPGLQLGPPSRWWDDKTVAKTIGLRKDQQKKMDLIFNSNKSSIIDNYNTLQREQAKLNSLAGEAQPDRAKIFAQIDVVNQSRSTLEKSYAQMQLQIRQEMEPDQISRMDKYREKPADDTVN